MKTDDVLFDALGDRTRRQIYELIARRPRAVGELVREVSITQPSVSQHLRILRDAGLVAVEPQGTRRIYHPRQEGLERLRRYVDSLWTAALTDFSDYMDQQGEDR